MNFRHPRIMLLGAIFVAQIVSCGDLRTGTARPGYTIDPAAQDGLPAHDAEADWPVESLPTSVLLTDRGGARYLRDHVYIRVRNGAGLSALLASYPFLRVTEPLRFINIRGEERTIPWPDLQVHADGSIAEASLDVVAEINWDRLDAETFAGVELPYAEQVNYRFDSLQARALLQMLLWIHDHDAAKIVAIDPILLALDPDDDSVPKGRMHEPPNCACIVGPGGAGTQTYDARRYDPNPDGELEVLDCSRDLYPSGYDLLTVRAATVSNSWEPLNDAQKLKMWVIPAEDYPFTLPGGTWLYASLFETNQQFENHVPPHAHDGTLPGPFRPGESAYCEWNKNDIPYTLAYRNTGVWAWKNDGTDPTVGVLLYETDEEKCLIGSFLCGGNPDDLIDHIAPLTRAETLAGVTRGTRGVEITLETIEECRTATGEACNGLDDTCDNAVDESPVSGVGNECAPKWTSVDELCQPGAGACDMDGVLRCEGYVEPKLEACNNMDDDCDGTKDEDTPGAGMLCGANIGACKPGVIACVDGDDQCVGAVGPADVDTCGDGLDNDCDGSVDEGCPCQLGDEVGCGIDTGECTTGTQVCVQGQWEPCSGVGPSPEVCDGADNDCNGAEDEGLLNMCGFCGPEPVEVCNHDDDDCDGLTDEDNDQQNFGLQNACKECGPLPDEVCNGDDDDCDGLTDEGLADCGVTVVFKPFTLNGGAEDTVIAVPKPAYTWTRPLVYLDEVKTGDDDDFEYKITPNETTEGYVFTVHTSMGNGQSTIVGRVGVLAGGPDVPAPATATMVVANDQPCPVDLPTLDLGVPASLLMGTRTYTSSGDDDFSFRLWSDPDVTAEQLSGCGWGGDGGSSIAAWAHLVDFPDKVMIQEFSLTVWNGAPQALMFDMSGATEIHPLIAMTEYDTNDDDDASWKIKCNGPPNQHVCIVELYGGNGGSKATARGVLLGVKP